MAFLDEVLTDRVTAQARQVDVGRVVLSLLVGLFFGVGWCAAKAVTGLVVVLRGVLLAIAWVGVAVREGWRAGRRRSA